MSNYATSPSLEQSEIDAFGGLDNEPEAKPKPKKSKHKAIKCRQPGCKQEIISDGYGEWVHAETWMYSCAGNTRDKDDIRVARR
jgi:hypothetical protein